MENPLIKAKRINWKVIEENTGLKPWQVTNAWLDKDEEGEWLVLEYE